MTDSKMPERIKTNSDGKWWHDCGQRAGTSYIRADLAHPAPVADAELEALVDGWASLIDDVEREIAMDAEDAIHTGERYDLWERHVFLDLHTAKVTLAALRARTAQPVGVRVKQDAIHHDQPLSDVVEWLTQQASRDYTQAEIDAFRMAARILSALLPEGGA